jgi:LPPG:FO 2-phospho-L-lactate transferase
MNNSILALAGGVGGAKLAWGLAEILPPGELNVVVNSGDDEEFHGLYVSPDLDTMMYTLAGIVNPETGWGLLGDTYKALGMLENYGIDTWFNLGDRDLATHIRRTQLLAEGKTLSEVSEELCRGLGLKHVVIPMSDQPVRTIVETDEGVLTFQEYFVKRRCEPKVTELRFEWALQATPSPKFSQALRDSKALVVCPSNPFLSTGPILAIPGVRESIKNLDVPKIVVSPIIGGKAIKGPAAKLLRELGHDVSSLGVAKDYQGLCDIFVIDEEDRNLASQIEELGMRVHTTKTLMSTPADKIALAQNIIDLIKKH